MDVISLKHTAAEDLKRDGLRAWRPIPSMARSHHRTRTELLVSAHFTPFKWFLLNHRHCRFYHHILATKFTAAEIPELADDRDPGICAVAIQLGACPNEESVAVNLTTSFIRLHLPLENKQDKFAAVGHTCIIVRLTDRTVRILGMISTACSLGAYEIEATGDGELRGRGALVQRQFMARLFSSDRKIITPQKDKSDIVFYAEHLHAMATAFATTQQGQHATWTAFCDRTKEFTNGAPRGLSVADTIFSIGARYRPRDVENMHEGLPYPPHLFSARTNWRDEYEPLLAKAPLASVRFGPNFRVVKEDWSIWGHYKFPEQRSPSELPWPKKEEAGKVEEQHLLGVGRLLSPEVEAISSPTGDDVLNAPGGRRATTTYGGHQTCWAEMASSSNAGTYGRQKTEEMDLPPAIMDDEVWGNATWASEIILETEDLEIGFFPPFMRYRWGKDMETFHHTRMWTTLTTALIGTRYWPPHIRLPQPWVSNLRYTEYNYGSKKPILDMVKLISWLVDMREARKEDLRKEVEAGREMTIQFPGLKGGDKGSHWTPKHKIQLSLTSEAMDAIARPYPMTRIFAEDKALAFKVSQVS